MLVYNVKCIMSIIRTGIIIIIIILNKYLEYQNIYIK